MIFACFGGLILFLLRIKFPPIIVDTLNSVGSMNTPLAMIIAGVSVAQSDILSMVRNYRLYLVSALKLLVMPAIFLVILVIAHTDSAVAGTLLITCACPVGATCTLFSLRFGKDDRYASQLYSFSTIFSVLTIPLVMYIADFLIL